MKRKVLACLLVCVIAFTLALPAFAADLSLTHAAVCPRCGVGRIFDVEIAREENGGYDVPCIHGYVYGSDFMRKYLITYQPRCNSCPLVGGVYQVPLEVRECYGHY